VKVKSQQPVLGGAMIVGNITGDEATRNVWVTDRGRCRRVEDHESRGA
jgi:hypothetical protein